MKDMARMTISLSKKEMEKLKKLSQEEHRPYSNQIVHMMEFYIKNKE